LFVDGARLGYGLNAAGGDVTLADLAKYSDVFYIGGTKCGAMFGEAVVIINDALKPYFRSYIKQNGGMLAKGWLTGAQFQALFENDLYLEISAHANRMADRIRQSLKRAGFPLYISNCTNQIFPIIPDSVLAEIAKDCTFVTMNRIDDTHCVARFCTSWASKEEDIAFLCNLIEKYPQ
jgi:threonine aldolase